MENLNIFLNLLEHDYDPEWSVIEIDNNIRPRDYFEYAVQDLDTNDQNRAAINSLSNAKRALHYQVDLLVEAFGYASHKNRNNFHSKIDYCAKCGIVTPRILKKINLIRNKVEHDYIVPTMDEVNDFLDVVELFLAATDRFFYRFPDNVVFPGDTNESESLFKGIFNIKLLKGAGEIIVMRSVGEETVSEKVVAPEPEFFMWVRFLNLGSQ